MMQTGPIVEPCWPIYSSFHSILDQSDLNVDLCTRRKYHDFANPTIITDDFDDVRRWLCDDDQRMEEIPTDSYIWSPNMSMNSNDSCTHVPYETQSSMVNKDDVMDVESQTGYQNLLMAHAESTGLGQQKLAEVIKKCIVEKASPNGPAIERLAFNLFKCGENQEQQYLIHESNKNFKNAFRAFYEIFPYGRFAHFAANSTIIEAVPFHAESIHIVDFNLCIGSQWPPVIEDVARMNKSLIITSIKHHQYQDSQFEQTKRQLCNFARSFGLNLKVQEIETAQIAKILDGGEFVVFNCMIELPHMGSTRTRLEVMDFLKLAQEVLVKNKGIITLGDGEDFDEKLKKSSDFSAFFNKYLTHYKALYESMEWGFPSYLNEARITMETLFVAPLVSSESWFQKWKYGRENMVFEKVLGLNGWPIILESLNEAKELVKEGESPYRIRIEGDNGNQMVLEWNETPLVRVSTFTFELYSIIK
ncbi:protein NODULATION SIGNALING PATHWAY 2-like [Rutidosis leptorrhynchoides]|uniref:protein NODULATION SIGNALING PATHWAY 2-like n=1 Tax=Rutidosis leptorrhynchoides TaxID=125765 RepID=UPI003A995191